MLQATPSGMSGEPLLMFTSELTIDSNEFTDSGSYCCVAAVIGSGDSNKMGCVTLSMLGKNQYIANNFSIFVCVVMHRYQHIRRTLRSNCWNNLQYYLHCTRS